MFTISKQTKSIGLHYLLFLAADGGNRASFVQLRSMRPEGEVKSAQSRASEEAAIRETVAVFQRYRLDYGRAIAVAREARARLGILPQIPARRQARILPDTQRKAFLDAVEISGNAQHILLFMLLDGSPLRASEVVDISREAVTFKRRTVEIALGGERPNVSVQIPASRRAMVEQYLINSKNQWYLFESRHRAQLSMRWLQMLARKYGDEAGIPEMQCRLLHRTKDQAKRRVQFK